mgnify:CR=1 FL=1
MSRTITIDPITRLEGHGKIDIVLDESGDVVRYPRLFIIHNGQPMPYEDFEQEGGERPHRVVGIVEQGLHAVVAARRCELRLEQDGERRATVYFDVRSPLLAAAWHAPPTGHSDAEALDAMSQILSAGRSSRPGSCWIPTAAPNAQYRSNSSG